MSVHVKSVSDCSKTGGKLINSAWRTITIGADAELCHGVRRDNKNFAVEVRLGALFLYTMSYREQQQAFNARMRQNRSSNIPFSPSGILLKIDGETYTRNSVLHASYSTFWFFQDKRFRLNGTKELVPMRHKADFHLYASLFLRKRRRDNDALRSCFARKAWRGFYWERIRRS